MNKLIFAIASLAVLMHLVPACAKASEPSVVDAAHSISDLIGDWNYFRHGILQKTKQFDKYSDIRDSQLATLPHTLVGSWSTESHPNISGYQMQSGLSLHADNTFNYDYVVLSGNIRQVWGFSGHWEVKNRILMLLIEHSTYPGEQKHDVLFWRLLHVGDGELVYVRSGTKQLVSMTKEVEKFGS